MLSVAVAVAMAVVVAVAVAVVVAMTMTMAMAVAVAEMTHEVSDRPRVGNACSRIVEVVGMIMALDMAG